MGRGRERGAAHHTGEREGRRALPAGCTGEEEGEEGASRSRERGRGDVLRGERESSRERA
jgi:hypothetical protein